MNTNEQRDGVDHGHLLDARAATRHRGRDRQAGRARRLARAPRGDRPRLHDRDASEALSSSGHAVEGHDVAVQGFGNVGSVAALLLYAGGRKVVAIGDRPARCTTRGDRHRREAVAWVQEHGTLEGYRQRHAITNDELLTLDVDVLVPAALENVITTKNAARVRARIIVEGANGPTTAAADPILDENGVFVIPDILANAGGVTVCYFEWVQNRDGLLLDARRSSTNGSRKRWSASSATC